MANYWFMIDKGYLWYKDATKGMDRKTKQAFHRETVFKVLNKAGVLDKKFKTREAAQKAMVDNDLSEATFEIYEVSNGLAGFFPAPK